MLSSGFKFSQLEMSKYIDFAITLGFPITDRHHRHRGPPDHSLAGVFVRVDGQAYLLEHQRCLVSHHGGGQYKARDVVEGQGVDLLISIRVVRSIGRSLRILRRALFSVLFLELYAGPLGLFPCRVPRHLLAHDPGN